MFQILIVEDDPSMREMLTTVLKGRGYEVQQAENGTQALSLLETSYFDLVVTDLLMPESDGIELLMSLREHYPPLRMIAITGARRVSSALLPITERLGAMTTLQKPFGMEEFTKAVEAALVSAPEGIS